MQLSYGQVHCGISCLPLDKTDDDDLRDIQRTMNLEKT